MAVVPGMAAAAKRTALDPVAGRIMVRTPVTPALIYI